VSSIFLPSPIQTDIRDLFEQPEEQWYKQVRDILFGTKKRANCLINDNAGYLQPDSKVMLLPD